MALKPAESNRLLNRGRVPGDLALIACCMALAAASTLASRLVLSSNPYPVGYLPGGLLGLGIFVAGQIALPTRTVRLLRATLLAVSGLLAWRLALATVDLGGTLRWINASLVGALGVTAGMLLAWPQVSRRRLIVAMTIAGFAGGILFALGSTRLYGSMPAHPLLGREQSTLLLIWLWQAGLMSTAAIALRSPTDTTP